MSNLLKYHRSVTQNLNPLVMSLFTFEIFFTSVRQQRQFHGSQTLLLMLSRAREGKTAISDRKQIQTGESVVCLVTYIERGGRRPSMSVLSCLCVLNPSHAQQIKASQTCSLLQSSVPGVQGCLGIF